MPHGPLHRKFHPRTTAAPRPPKRPASDKPTPAPRPKAQSELYTMAAEGPAASRRVESFKAKYKGLFS